MAERDGVDVILEQWRRERPELDPSPIGVIGRISRLARELEQRLEAVYRDTASSPAGTTCSPPCAAPVPPTSCARRDFAGTLMLTSSGTTKRLDRLEQAGLITRAPDPDDRRGDADHPHRAGHRLIDAVTEAHLDNERDLLGALTADEQRRLADLLRKLQLGLPAL